MITISGRKRAGSISSASAHVSPKKKGKGERLVHRGRDHVTVGTSFVSGSAEISVALVEKVSIKACQFQMTFETAEEGNQYYYGQGGLIRGDALHPPEDTTEENKTPKKKKRKKSKKRASFSEFPCFASTPVTAKHNLENASGEQYVQTTVQSVDALEAFVTMPDGGCVLSDEGDIEVRPAAGGASAMTWADDDLSFGENFERYAQPLTRKPRLFEKIPDVRSVLQVGHKIGIAVYRTFDITHEDAGAASNVVLEDFYGQKLQACIYTGEVTELSANGKTFCHNINTFAGCSGAVVFLLDQNQQVALEDDYHGMAVGVHVGGLDMTNNIGFLLL